MHISSAVPSPQPTSFRGLFGFRRFALELSYEVSEAGHRLPRWHLPRLDHLEDAVAPAARVGVGSEGELAHLARPVTALAVVLDQARDLVAPRDRLALRAGARRQHDERGEDHEAAQPAWVDHHRKSSARLCGTKPSTARAWALSR